MVCSLSGIVHDGDIQPFKNISSLKKCITQAHICLQNSYQGKRRYSGGDIHNFEAVPSSTNLSANKLLSNLDFTNEIERDNSTGDHHPSPSETLSSVTIKALSQLGQGKRRRSWHAL